MNIKEEDIQQLFEQWSLAIQTRDSKKVTILYDNNALLIPTISNKVRHNHDEISDYFEQFLMREPKVNVDKSYIRIFQEMAIHSGIYSFEFNDALPVQARFTFIYRDNGQGFKIIEHHSSAMPEVF